MAPFHETSAYIAEPLPHDLSNHVDRAIDIFGASICWPPGFELALLVEFQLAYLFWHSSGRTTESESELLDRKLRNCEIISEPI